jgi:hypothetical protein
MKPMAAVEETTAWMGEGVEVSDNSKIWRMSMSQAARRISFTSWLMLLALMVAFAGCNNVCFPR